jgi:hypothetical protein
MLENKRLTGIGTLSFVGASQMVLNDEFAGVSLMYSATQGEEDKKDMPNPEDNLAYLKFFDEMYNND